MIARTLRLRIKGNMSKLIRVENFEVCRFEGYIAAAQHVFKRGELDLGLEAALFEITNKTVTDEEVVNAGYSEFSPVPIEHRSESAVEEMVTNINARMTIARTFFKPEYSFAELIETDLREGYWQHLEACSTTNTREL